VAAASDEPSAIELTHKWDHRDLGQARNFGHIAVAVEDIYAFCQTLIDSGVTINHPPRDGRMAFVRSPDNISTEIFH